MKVGDKVVWFKRSQRGGVISVRKFVGVVKALDGDAVTLRTESGGTVHKAASELTLKENDTPFSIFEKAL